jgi:hypothetical protein
MKIYKQLLVENTDEEIFTEEEMLQLFEELDLDTHTYTTEFLAEELGFQPLEESYESAEDIAAKRTGYAMNQNLPKPKPTQYDYETVMRRVAKEKAKNNNAKTHNKFFRPEKSDVVKESYTQEDLLELFEALNLDTNKYTFDYLAEQLGFETLYPKDEHFQEVDVKPVLVESAKKQVRALERDVAKDKKNLGLFPSLASEQKKEALKFSQSALKLRKGNLEFGKELAAKLSKVEDPEEREKIKKEFFQKRLEDRMLPARFSEFVNKAQSKSNKMRADFFRTKKKRTPEEVEDIHKQAWNYWAHKTGR